MRPRVELASAPLRAATGRPSAVAAPPGPPLALVGAQQPAAGPATHGGGKLPAEIDRVPDAGVHAEAAGRRHQVGGVAGDEDAGAAVAVGDELAAHPPHDRENLVIEVAAHAAAQRGADISLALVHH